MQLHRFLPPSPFHQAAVACFFLAVAGATHAAAQCPTATGTTLVAETPLKYEELGHAVALDGDLLAASSPWHDGAGHYAGAVRVFHRGAHGVWKEAATLVPAGLTADSAFGYRLAMRGDVIAATTFPYLLTEQGRLHVFERTGPGPGDWTEVLAFGDPSWTPTQITLLDSLALDGDDTLFLGQGLHSGAVEHGGAVFVFERTAPGTWVHTGMLFDPEPLVRGRFGASVAIEGDLAVVGAIGARDFWTPVQHGSAHVFRRDPAAPAGWSHVVELPATLDTFGTEYGAAVAIGGGRIFVGAPGNYFVGVPGRVEVFEQDAAGSWTSVRVLEQSAEAISPVQSYGQGLVWSDGYLAVSAPSFDGFGPAIWNLGAVYLYHEDKGGPGAFGLVELMLSPLVDPGYRYGSAIDAQDGLLVIGAAGDDGPCGVGGGPFGACNYGLLYLDSLEPDAPLAATPPSISLSQGGVQTIEVREGSCFAGHVSLVAGSASGTVPGFGLGPWTVPLNPDAYFVQSVTKAGSGPFVGTLALLDASGAATSKIAVPAGLSPSLAGLVLHHASALLEPSSFAVLDVSAAVPLALVP